MFEQTIDTIQDQEDVTFDTAASIVVNYALVDGLKYVLETADSRTSDTISVEHIESVMEAEFRLLPTVLDDFGLTAIDDESVPDELTEIASQIEDARDIQLTDDARMAAIRLVVSGTKATVYQAGMMSEGDTVEVSSLDFASEELFEKRLFIPW